MKVVLLLAGKGRRLGKMTENRSKVFIELLGKPVLAHLVERFLQFGLREIVPILGFQQETIMKYLTDTYGARQAHFQPVVNPKYEVTNNLYSLWSARDSLSGQDFIVCNGDLIFHPLILKYLVASEYASAIAIDDQSRVKLDSPSVIVKEGRIYDLGRHIPLEKSGGYAIGLYKFGRDLSVPFFREAEKVLADNMSNAGFHDPLINLFPDYPVYRVSTQGQLWTDIDVPEDIPRAAGFIEKIQAQVSAGGMRP